MDYICDECGCSIISFAWKEGQFNNRYILVWCFRCNRFLGVAPKQVKYTNWADSGKPGRMEDNKVLSDEECVSYWVKWITEQAISIS